MEPELIDPSANDPASKAFDRLRREVTTMRLAVEHLADAPGKIEIPDYTATLDKLARATQANAANIKEMAVCPGIQMTPASLSEAISKAGANARAADHAALVNATTALHSAVQSITKSLLSARTAMEQDKRLKKVSFNCLIAGMITGAIFPALFSKALPATWHLPERMVALTMGTDAWGAGQRLMAFDSPDRWNAILNADQTMRTNEKVWAACHASARKSGKPVRCQISIAPSLPK